MIKFGKRVIGLTRKIWNGMSPREARQQYFKQRPFGTKQRAKVIAHCLQNERGMMFNQKSQQWEPISKNMHITSGRRKVWIQVEDKICTLSWRDCLQHVKNDDKTPMDLTKHPIYGKV